MIYVQSQFFWLHDAEVVTNRYPKCTLPRRALLAQPLSSFGKAWRCMRNPSFYHTQSFRATLLNKYWFTNISLRTVDTFKRGLE